MFDLDAIQGALREAGLGGWLLCDFRGSNVLARRVLDLEGKPSGSRRFFYVIPAQGPPRKLVHKIEPGALDHLPGEKRVYLRWQDLEAGVADLVAGLGAVAMEYSPRNANPYIGRVDAGTVELVRSAGVEVVPSGDLVQRFEAAWDDEQWASHREADAHTRSAFDLAFGLIADRARAGDDPATECQVQAAILEHFRRHGLTTYSPPIVAVGPHSGDPHYEPRPAHDTPIRRGDFVLIDLWAKVDRPRSVYSDLTCVGYVGEAVPARFAEPFAVVVRARDAAIARVREAFAEGRSLRGWEVDDAARHVIEAAGLGEFLFSRTGHSIGQEVHGNGAHMDNLESRDERLVIPRTCFSIEPGVYFPEFGMRSEVDLFIDGGGAVHVTGIPQTRVLPILEPGARLEPPSAT